jgi:trans-aconitate 2-methyltransferase
MEGYAFGDNEVAAYRLALVAETFEPPSRAFLIREAPPSPVLALDLGCGPGHSTRLVAEVTGAVQAIGLDTSEPFLAMALASEGGAQLAFVQHDVTVSPWPVGPAPLVYCRLLLAHLPDPEGVVRDWAAQLPAGGRLLLDELEYIETGHPVLARYEEVVVRVVAARGGLMYAGPRVAAMAEGPGWRRVSNQVCRHPVPVPRAAHMYRLNLETGRDDPALAGVYSREQLDGLALALDELAGGAVTDEAETVTWGLRQVVIEREAAVAE